MNESVWAQISSDPDITDIHIRETEKIVLRQKGILKRTKVTAEGSLFDFIINRYFSDEKITGYQTKGDSDAACTIGNKRYRIHLYRTCGKRAAAIRVLPELSSLPPDPDAELLYRMSSLSEGLIIVAGATGSGKSTTLARILKNINESKPCHIVTLEDPIEYVIPSEKALIHQREIGADVSCFADGMRASLREDPDVIALGELRDSETIAAALTAAETGHLVLGTLHTGKAVDTVRRMIHVFEGKRQSEIRALLASVLRFVVVQQLYEGLNGRAVVRECLVNIPAVAHLIREGKEEQVGSYMESGQEGMRTLKQAVLSLPDLTPREQAALLS